jgi:subtilisin family serine protease
MRAWARKPLLVGLWGIAALQIGAPLSLATQLDGDRRAVAGRLLVQLRADLPERARRDVLGRFGLTLVDSLHPLDIVLVEAPEHADTRALASRLPRLPSVLWAEPNYLCRAALAAPNDPAYSELVGDLYVQWPAHFLDALAAWSSFPGSYFDAASRPQEAPVVALIDTGIDAAHPDFMNPGAPSTEASEGGQLLLSLARVFLGGEPDDGSADVIDEHGHGTHIAGLIAAGADNGITAGSGIAGIGYHARLLPLKAAGANGVATHADISRAIIYAADQGAPVILIAFAGPTWSQTLQDAIDCAWARGCFIIAPAGDSGATAPVFPAACPHVFAVAALSAAGSPACYSSPGDHVAVAAPGGDDAIGVYSALPTYACTLRQSLTGPAYGWAYGTSQAAAHVAGAAALYAGLSGMRLETGGEGRALWQALQQSAAAAGETAPAAWHPDRGYGTLAPAGLLAGQAPGPDGLGSIVGRVLLNGRPALGASVSVEPDGGGAVDTAAAGWPAGAYRIANLPPGTYKVTAEADDLSAEWRSVTVLAGCDTPGVDFRLGDPPAGAALLSAGIPGAAVRGETMEISLTFANVGESTWRRADGYCLEQAACESPISTTPQRAGLMPGEDVVPGGERAFAVSLPVPDVVGFYQTAWQMCQQGGAGPFGDVARGAISVTSFLDVPADHWAVREIEAAKAAGVVCGYADHRYQPLAAVTRDQMAVYLARALAGGDECVPPGPELPSFVDIPADYWAYRHVEYVHSRDVAHGYDDDHYHPDYPLDRAQMAVFMARGVAGGESALTDYVAPDTPSFSDVPTDFWAYKHVEYLAALGVVAGYSEGNYRPEYTCSRDQMAVYITRAFDLASASAPAG